MAGDAFTILTTSQWEAYKNQQSRALAAMTGINSAGAFAVPPRPDTRALRGDRAVEFVLWLNTVMDILDAELPTQAQWDKVRERAALVVADCMRSRLIDGERSYTQEYEEAVRAYEQQVAQFKSLAGAAAAAPPPPATQTISIWSDQVKKIFGSGT